MKAMILSAGLGTRLRPVTDNMPKALVPLNAKPLLEYTILKLKAAGFDEIIVNVHHFPEMITDFLHRNHNFDIRIEISDERDELLDTGGGIKNTAGFFDDGKPFLIHNVDILSNIDLKQLYDQHLSDPARLTTMVVSSRNTYRYLLFDEQNRLRGWINEKTRQTEPEENMDARLFNKLAYAGIQIISPRIFQLMENYDEKFSIMKFYLEHSSTEKIIGYVPKDFQMMDMGKIDLLKSGELFIRDIVR